MPDPTGKTADDSQADQLETLVVDYLKAGANDPVTGKQLGEAGVDVAIGIVTLGLTAMGIPGAGAALGALKGIFFGDGDAIPDAVAKQFETIKKDINALKDDVSSLQQQLNEANAKAAMDANKRRCQIVVLALADVKDRALELPTAARKDAAGRKTFVDQVLNRADAFLELGEDVWTWDNLRVQGKSKSTGTVNVERETTADANIALTPYLQAIGVLAAAIDKTGVRPAPSKLHPHFDKLHQLLSLIGGSGGWAKTPGGLQYADDGLSYAKVAGPYLAADSGRCSITLRCASAYATRTKTFQYAPRNDPDYGLQCPYDPSGWDDAWETLRSATWAVNSEAIGAITNAIAALEAAGKFRGEFDTSHTFQMDTLYAIDGNGDLYKFQHLMTTTLPTKRKGSSVKRSAEASRAIKTAGKSYAFWRAALQSGTSGAASPAGLQSLRAVRESWRTRLDKGLLHGPTQIAGPQTTHDFSRAMLEGGSWSGFGTVVVSEWAGADLLVYGILPNGDLMWRRIPQVIAGPGATSAPVFEAPKPVGHGWTSMHNVFSTGEGIIYATASNGELVWYRHQNNRDGTAVPVWEQHPVGSNWNQFPSLMSPGDGVIYAVRNDGLLFWYRHVAYLTGGRASEKGAWEGPTKVGNGWNDFKHLTAVSADPAGLLVNPTGKRDAHIYAVNTRGELLYYVNHDMYAGSTSWDDPVKLADGWDKFVCIFAAMGARATVVR